MDEQYTQLADAYASKQDGYYDLERADMLEFIPEGISTVLDVGCSSGGFGGALKRTRPGVTVWGIEPNGTAAEKARGRLDNVITGQFQAGLPELENRRFDAIVFNDVLEHLPNPEKALEVAREYLIPGGSIIASIPNVLHFYNITNILFTQDWKYEDSGIMDNTHLRFFTKKSIMRLFESAGLKIVRLEGISASYGLKYRLVNALTLGRLTDWRFVQFAVEAKLI